MRKLAFVLIVVLLVNSTIYAENSILERTAIYSPGSSSSDWSAIALSVSNLNFDEDTYIQKLKEYVVEKYNTKNKLSPYKATEWHRISIALNLLGQDATNFYGVNLINDGIYYRENIGRQGINGYIWGLIALSSGNYPEPADALNTKESLISTILSKQNSDGSFSQGNTPGCDITAMAVYALSFYKNRENVSKAINNAMNYLTSIQNSNGTFSENGVPNCESTAQVIIAIAALGKKVDSTIYNALLSFETDDGFSHIKGGNVDIISTYQAYCALAAANTKRAIYSNYHKNTTSKTVLNAVSSFPKKTLQPTESPDIPTSIETVDDEFSSEVLIEIAEDEDVSEQSAKTAESEPSSEALIETNKFDKQNEKIVPEIDLDAVIPTEVAEETQIIQPEVIEETNITTEEHLNASEVSATSSTGKQRTKSGNFAGVVSIFIISFAILAICVIMRKRK